MDIFLRSHMADSAAIGRIITHDRKLASINSCGAIFASLINADH
jgi:hypothetical protein